jgi:hypothetical protein
LYSTKIARKETFVTKVVAKSAHKNLFRCVSRHIKTVLYKMIQPLRLAVFSTKVARCTFVVVFKQIKFPRKII